MRSDPGRIRGHAGAVDEGTGDPAARALRLLSLLSTGRAWSGAELAARLGVSPRTVRRDAERLRNLGYAVAARPGPGGSYRLAAGSSMPPLLLSDDEAVTVMAALALAAPRLAPGDAAARALVKLRQVVPARLRARADATSTVTEVVTGRSPTVDPVVIGDLAAAAAEDGRVRFAYRSRHGRASTRTVDPYREVVVRGYWYLLGVDVERDAWRTFRLDRIEAVTRLPGRYRRRALPAENAATYLAADFHRPGTPVSIVFHLPARRMADLLATADGELTALSADRCRYRTHAAGLAWFAATTAALGVPFTVEHPAELAEHCRALAAILERAGRAGPPRPDRAIPSVDTGCSARP
jgi:predicted DNA-binding transcriptional regulator YafY